MKVYSNDEVLRTLDAIVDKIGMSKLAEIAGVGRTTVHAAVHGDRGDRGLNVKIAAALGFRPVSGWEPIPDFDDSALRTAIEEDRKQAEQFAATEKDRKAQKAAEKQKK